MKYTPQQAIDDLEALVKRLANQLHDLRSAQADTFLDAINVEHMHDETMWEVKDAVAVIRHALPKED